MSNETPNPRWHMTAPGSFKLPSGDAVQPMDMEIAMPPPPEGWRRIAPEDCIGYPTISHAYAMELAEMAKGDPLFRDGCTITAKYHKVDGEWHPIPGTLQTER